MSNWTAQAEVVGPEFDAGRPHTEKFPAGWRVFTDPDWDPRHGAWFAKPATPDIAGALDDMYDHRGDPATRQAALDRAATRRADLIFETHWRPILAHMESELSTPSRQQRRQAQRMGLAAAR